MTKRKRVIQGGTSASKTYGIIAVLIDTALEFPNQVISVISESVPHLRRGALKDFLKIMKEIGLYREDQYNRTLLTYQFINGSYIEFFSAQDERGARRDILFINECYTIPFKTYHHYAVRTNKEIYLDFNPANEFWVHTDLLGDKDVESLTLTYKDNEALEQTIIDDIEIARTKAETSEYWANWWKVYGLGLLGTLQGVVFDNWEIVGTVPSQARLLGNGLDFGYTNHPTAIIALYKFNDTILFDEIVYSTGLTNPDIVKEYETAGGNKATEIIADSAEPKSIEECRRLGMRIYPCTKGRDSINYGIEIMQQYKFMVTERSTNLIKELRNYMWDTDKSGKNLQKPIDAFNHALDACRYICMEKLGQKKTGGGMRASGYSRKRGN